MSTLAAVIEREFDEPWYRDDLAALVGHRSPAELAAWIEQIYRERLGRTPALARFASKSFGAVFGFDDVVLKLFPSSLSERMLRASERCLAAVVARGYPAPAQLVPTFCVDGIWGAFYELVEGEIVVADRRMLAEALAELARVTDGLDATDLPIPSTRTAALWPPPHRTSFDLERAGGEWIDERAAAAQRTIREADLPMRVAHFDWGAKNALVRDGELRAVLDWDSLVVASEAEMIGRAAVQFTLFAGDPPTSDEAAAFVRDYERARGRQLTAVEQRVAEASAEYLIAHVARCSPDDGPFVELLRSRTTQIAF